MDGKPTIKIMNKIQLLSTLRLKNSQCQLKNRNTKKFHSRKRGSTPLVSTTISAQRKNNNHSSTLRKLQTNNFMTSNVNLQAVASCKRILQCHTAMARTLTKKQAVPQKTQAQKLLFRNSDKLQKLLWNQPQQNLPPLVISADFVMNQDEFWSAPVINPSIIKAWKELHKNYYIIWIVKLQKGFKKIKQFCQNERLPLNAVYYHKRQSRYTVDYSSLRRQLIKVYGSALHQIRFVENLKLNTKDIYEASTFVGRVPLMFDSRFKVCYIRGEQNGQGLDLVLEAAKNSLYSRKSKLIELLSIKIYVQDHFKQIEEQKNERNKEDEMRAKTIQDRCAADFVDEQLVEKEVQKFRRQLVEQIIKQKGRNFQYEGFSVHYFVGDIIKRNYQLLLEKATRRLQTKFIQNNRKQYQIEQMVQYKQLGIVQKFYQYCL